MDLIFKDLTKEQAITLAEWFSAQGEQHCDEWFDINNVKSPMVNH